jgi:serine-type D-Ala-D-Ala carboxypeptidase (penicillin-binding protein 5/6)
LDIYVLRFICILIVILNIEPLFAQSFQTAAPNAILYDVGTRSVLFEKDADKPVPPASLVKVMTAAVVFQEIASGRLKLDDEMTVSANAWRKGGAIAGNSAMFLTPNQRPKLSDLITGLVVASGNDAAITLAEGISGSEENFVALMNERGKAMGLRHSTFANPTGLPDAAQKVSVRDLMLVSDYIIREHPELYKFFAIKEMIWGKTKQQNRNPLLLSDAAADGLKTGNSDEAGFGLIGSSVVNGQRLIVIVHGLKTATDRSLEARKLLDWGYRSFEPRVLFNASAVLGVAKVYGGEAATIGVASLVDIRTLVPKGDLSKVTATIVYNAPLKAPIAKGAEIARLKVKRGDINVLDAPLVAVEAVNEGSLTQRARDGAWELVSTGFKRGFAKIMSKGAT